MQRKWIVLCPGVVFSLHALIYAFTQTDAAVILQLPVYAPFLSASKIAGRRLLLNPLKFKHSRYRFDLDHCAADGARLLLLCSPHNPIGRVWQAQELQALLEICQRYGITVVSNEIHAVYPGEQHKLLVMLAQGVVNVITAVAPSKTFNIPGLGLSVLIIPDERDRTAIGHAFDMLYVSAANPFSIAAFEAAYRGGAPWLDELLDYLAVTRDFVRTFMQQQLHRIKLIEQMEPICCGWTERRCITTCRGVTPARCHPRSTPMQSANSA